MSSRRQLMIWDFLAIVGVIIPTVLGGFRTSPGSTPLELWLYRFSDRALPTLILTMVAWVFSHLLGLDLRQSWILSWGSRLLDQWRFALTRRAWRALSVAAVSVALLWSAVSLSRHAAFESHAFDVGIFTNAIWSLTHGLGYISSVKGGISLFADHQSPIFWLLAPIFAVWPRPETLLVLQAFGLAFGALPLFAIGRQYLRSGEERVPWQVAILPLLYWAYQPLRHANAFEFHPEVLMLPLFLGAIAGMQSTGSKARWFGALALLLGLACKESAGPVAVGIGAAWLIGAGPENTRSFTRRVGVIVVPLGLAVFLFDLKVVPRFVGASDYAYQGVYSQFGQGLGALLLAPFTHPQLFAEYLLGPRRLEFLFWTLAPLGFWPLLGARALIASVPGYLMLFLSSEERRVSILHHYVIEPGVGIFWALSIAAAILVIRSRSSLRLGNPALSRRDRWLTWALIVLAFATSGRSEVFKIRKFGEQAISDPHIRWIRREFLPAIDAQASLSVSEALVPHLSIRPWVHGLDSVRMADGQAVDCVIRDLSLSNWPMEPSEVQALDQSLPALGFRVLYRCGSVTVFAREGAKCFVLTPPCDGDT